MDDKKISYTIKWTQPYTEYELVREAVTEAKVENSDLQEAKDVLKQIMANK